MTECNSKVNHSETSALTSWLLPFEIAGKRFFGSRPKAFKHIPSASKLDKRQIFKKILCMLLLCFTRHRSHKARTSSPSWKHLSDAGSSCSFFVIPLCIFSPHRLASCVCRVTYAPRPPGSTPSVLPRDWGLVVALWRGWEKSLKPHSKGKKSSSLWGRRGTTWSMRGSVIFFSLWMFSCEVLEVDINGAWHLRGSAGGLNNLPHY